MTPRWGNVQLARVITYGAVAEWVGSMQRQGLSASRSRQAYHVLTAMMDGAVKDGRLVRNPALGVDLPRVVAKPRRYLRHDAATRPPCSRLTVTDTCFRTSWTSSRRAWTTPCASLMWSRCGPDVVPRPNGSVRIG